MNFALPSRSEVGYLDPEISNEGEKVILSDGDIVSYSPPPPRPVMPDWSQIKSIRHLFNRVGHQVYPAWFYHPTEEPKLIKNSEESKSIGIFYRKATFEEAGRYGLKAVWDWDEGCKWRPQPYPGTMKFDPMKPGQGKTYIHSQPNPNIAQNQLLEALIPAVAAAVAKSLNADGPKAPSSIDPKQWEEFLAFKAWQETANVVEAIQSEEDGSNALNSLALTEDQEREIWEKEAKDKGIRVDGRWSIDRLKSEVEKAA